MKTRAFLVLALFAVAGTLGCPGDGSRIPGTMGPAPGTTLAALQAGIFTPICSPCHQPGGIGPMPLDSEAASFASLVDVDSLEITTLKRVAPGDAENSYLVWKIEGRPTIVGSPMPLGGPMLGQAEIDMIRDWIDSGAQP
jgi:mono/diheme cytochrome c family protein